MIFRFTAARPYILIFSCCLAMSRRMSSESSMDYEPCLCSAGTPFNLLFSAAHNLAPIYDRVFVLLPSVTERGFSLRITNLLLS